MGLFNLTLTRILQRSCVSMQRRLYVAPTHGNEMESQRSLNMVNPTQLRPDVILSEENRRAFIQRFKLYKDPRKFSEKGSEAAVLVPICIHKGELGLLYTLRSTKLSANRGEVSFPGGMRDDTDKDFEETALRETWEELKIPKRKVEVWTSGNLIGGRRNVRVMPVVGYIGEVEPENLEINPLEVEEVFVVSLEKLCDPNLCGSTQFRNNITLPVYMGGKHRIWGLTAAITHMVLTALLPGIYTHKIQVIRPIEHVQKSLENSENKMPKSSL